MQIGKWAIDDGDGVQIVGEIYKSAFKSTCRVLNTLFRAEHEVAHLWRCHVYIATATLTLCTISFACLILFSVYFFHTTFHFFSLINSISFASVNEFLHILYSLPSCRCRCYAPLTLALCLSHTNDSFTYIWMWACVLYSWNWAWENLTFVIRRWRRSFAQIQILCRYIYILHRTHTHTHNSGRHRRC